MKIKLLKNATIEGIAARTASVHDVVERVAQKLIDRGYAELHKSEVTAEPEPQPELEVEADEDGTAS